MSTDRKIHLIDDTVEVGVDKGKVLETLGESLWDSVFDLADFKLGGYSGETGSSSLLVIIGKDPVIL